VKLFTIACLIFISSLKAQQIAELSFEQQLFEEQDQTKFQALLKQAVEKKLPAQVLFEAEFIHASSTSNDVALVNLLSTHNLDELLKNFDAKQSKILNSKRQLKGIIQYLLAISALEKKDEQKFKEHITESYWLFPQQAPILSEYIRKHRINKLTNNYKMDDEALLKNAQVEESIKWKDLKKDKEGVILFFYSPWDMQSTQHMELLPNLQEYASEQNLSLVLYCIETDGSVAEDNATYIKDSKLNDKCRWVLHNQDNDLVSKLEIQQLPTLIKLNEKNEI